MTTELKYTLFYVNDGEKMKSFNTKQEMEQFIAENAVRPLFQYEEKVECGL